MPTLFLSRSEISALLDMSATIDAVEEAFKQWGRGEAQMPPKAYLVLEHGDFRAMPASISGAAGIKWVNVHPENRSQSLPTVLATLIYNDPETGYPLAVMDGTLITAYRTGAAAAVASRYLARKNSHTLGIIGAGQQAQTQLSAHAHLFDLHLVKVFDKSQRAIEEFRRSFPHHNVRPSSLEEAAASDIVCTVTPSREPVIKRELILPGTHINAVGADAGGKQELDPLILRDGIVVVDDISQARSSGEINVPLEKSQYSIDQLHATLGEIVTGSKPGRPDDTVITVFDSTGVAIEDIAIAKLIYEMAKAIGGYRSLELVDG